MSILKNVLKTMSGSDSAATTFNFNKIFAFYSERSTGVTTTLLNVAHLLSEQYGKKVLVIDTNIMYPVSAYYLLEDKYTGKDLLSIESTDNKKEVISRTRFENVSYINIQKTGLYTLVSERDNLSVMDTVIDMFIGDFDYILIDVDKNCTNIALKSMILADVVLRVIEDTPVSIYNTSNVQDFFSSFGLNTSKAEFTIINKRIYDFSISDEELKELGYNVIGTIPFSVSIIKDSLTKKLCTESVLGTNKETKEIARGYSDIITFILGG